MTDTVDLHQHGHITVLLFLLIIKNYCVHDATYSEVDSKCEIDSFSMTYHLVLSCKYGGKHQVVGRHWHGQMSD